MTVGNNDGKAMHRPLAMNLIQHDLGGQVGIRELLPVQDYRRSGRLVWRCEDHLGCLIIDPDCPKVYQRFGELAMMLHSTAVAQQKQVHHFVCIFRT